MLLIDRPRQPNFLFMFQGTSYVLKSFVTKLLPHKYIRNKVLMPQQKLSRFFTSTKKDTVRNEPVVVKKEKAIECVEEKNASEVKNQLNEFAHVPKTTIIKEEKKVELLPNPAKKRKTKDDIESKKVKKNKLTDMEQQVVELKTAHMDKLLLIQVGYRYKFFGEDAQIAAQILNIKLTEGKLSYDFMHPAKDDHLYSTFAQSSIPLERLLIHVRRLLVKGYVVAVVDQIETAALREGSENKAKVFERKLSNVYSPGTFITDEDLEKNVNGKSILCINETIGGGISLVSANVFVSEVVYDQFDDDFTRINLESRLHHLEPIEIITVGDITPPTKECIKNFIKYNESQTSNIRHINVQRNTVQYNALLNELQSSIDNDAVFELLTEQNYQMLECFQKLIQYIKNYNLHSIFNLFDVYKKFADIDKATTLNANVIKSLEIFNNSTTESEEGSLFGIINQTLTKFGQRTLRNWLCHPLIEMSSILQRHEAVGYLTNKLNSLQVERVVNVLKKCPDLELMMSRIYHGRSNRKEVYLFLKKINEVLIVFEGIRDELISPDTLNSELLHGFFKDMKGYSADLNELEEMLNMIHSPNAIDTKSEDHIVNFFNNNFYLYSEIQCENDKIDEIKRLLDAELEAIRKTLNNKDTQYFKVSNEPYLIQVRTNLVKTIPKDWIRINATTNCVRFRSPNTVQLYKKLQYQQEMLKTTCNRLFDTFSRKVNEHQVTVTKLVRKLGVFDALVSLTNVAIINNYTRPKIVDFPTIQVKGSRNPISERLLQAKSYSRQSSSSTYIDNDFCMQPKPGYSRIGLISGPNMGGKSSFLRQIGLIVILSQIGSFVSCDSGSILGIFSNIHIRLGSNDDMFSGKSTFQVELTECRNILSSCSRETGNSLLLIDELGRGTSTVDGCSIAWSVLDYLANDVGSDVMVLFITHFKELEEYERKTNGIVKNYHLNFNLLNNNQDIVFTYKITPGSSLGSYGVYCAKIAGIPEQVITKAHKISQEVELQSEKGKLMKLVKTINSKDINQLLQLTEFL